MKAETLNWIDQEKPVLVKKAEDYVKDGRTYRPIPKKKKYQPVVTNSQLRNALRVIQMERSAAILINFMRYQIGREEWGAKHCEAANKLVKILEEEWTEPSMFSEKEHREVTAELISLFLGYVIREHAYRCKIEESAFNV